MSDRVASWAVRIGWAALPVAAGPALASALHPYGERTAVSIALWVGWAFVMMATLIAHPLSLTILRTAAPASIASSVAAAIGGHASAVAATVGLAWAVGAAAVAFSPAASMVCVNGPAYPNERRFPLAVAGALLLGPLELAWALVVVPPSAALWLLAGQRWGIGGAVTVVSVPLIGVASRALHGLSRRWVVFVPAGLVLHDPMGLLDPVLFPRQVIERLSPAPAGSDSLDLTQRAPGLALELILTEKVPMALAKGGRRGGEAGASSRLLFTPSRPGAVLAEAARRRLPVHSP